MDGSSAQDTQARIAARADVRGRAQHQASGMPGRLADLARTAAGQAATLTRKYPVRLVTMVGAALAGMIAGRRRRSG